MKFTNGYWLMKKEIDAAFAVEYYAHEVRGRELVLYAATRHIPERGATLNSPLLTVTLSSPMPDVIGVAIVHFDGGIMKPPYYEKCVREEPVSVEEDTDFLTYISGHTKAVVDKRPSSWGISFYRDGKLLTESSFRNMAYLTNRESGRHYVTEQLRLDVGEYVYGLGERYTPFVKNGQSIDIWNEDGGTASEQTYKNIPFYISNKGYGVFVDHSGDVSFELGSEKVERTAFSVEGERLSYYLFGGGTPKESVRLYAELTGKPALPPAWSFGLWLTTSFTTSYDEETVTGFIDGMEERNIPLHTFHFDCFWMKAYEWVNFTWDPDTFPDPPAMLKRLHDRGLHICVWINSYVGQKSPLFAEGRDNGYFVKKTDGSVWQTDLWQAGMALVDFTNPAAVRWYEEKLEALRDMGVDCFKTDFGERIPVTGITYYDGSDPVKMHNYYTYLYNWTVFQLLERKRGRGEAVVFARSATAGCQQFPAHWGGDCSATYLSMAETLRGGLSLSLAGFGFWSHDIGGFEQTAPADVYKRWCAFGLLSTHSRLHGSSSYRVPWLFDEEACGVLRFFVNLKCSLMPYLYGKAVESSRTGLPVLRPMLLEFPEDPTCAYLDRQYMLGDAMLIAPVMSEDGEVTYYLPEGQWTHLLSDDVRTGGRWYTERYDYFSLPLFVREGTILPVGKNTERPDYDYTVGTTIRIYELKDGADAGRCIPGADGQSEICVRASRSGDAVRVTTDGGSELRAEYVHGGVRDELPVELAPERPDASGEVR